MHTLYIISVALRPGVYRHIRIRSDATLLELHHAIVDAYDLEDIRAPSFMPKKQKEGERIKYSSNRTKTTQSMRDVRLKDTVFATTAYMTYSLAMPRLSFNCRTLETLLSDDADTAVVRASGQADNIFSLMTRLMRALDLAPDIIYDNMVLEEAESLGKEGIRTLVNYYLAGANLYGIVPLSTLYKQYCEHRPHISQDAFNRVCLEVSFHENSRVYVTSSRGNVLTEQDFRKRNPYYLVDFSVMDNDAYDEIIRLQGDLPYYAPDEEEFLRYAGQMYFEKNAAYHQLRRQLLRSGMSERVANETMSDIALASKYELIDPQVFFDLLNERGAVLRDGKAVQHMMHLYNDLIDNTRKHRYRGHTYNEIKPLIETSEPFGEQLSMVFPDEFELADMQADQRMPDALVAEPPQDIIRLADHQPRPKKPARNAPCPCGSGKKYKHCCGAPGKRGL